jgi:large subunit ribosomal protein L18
MDKNKVKNQKNLRRHLKVRSTISGTADVPRLNVFRSNRGMFLQIIDDLAGKTLASASTLELKNKKNNKIDLSKELGLLIAQKAKALNITKVVFDRGPYKYHGRIKAAAEGAREGGLQF